MANDFFTMMERLQGMFESDRVEVITNDGERVTGRIDNLRSTQPFSKPAVKIISADGKITKILFADIKEIIDHSANAPAANEPAPEAQAKEHASQ